MSVQGSFVKVTNIWQISPNGECSESCQTRLGWMACWTRGWNNPVWNRWGQCCSLPDSAFSASPEPWCGQRLSSHTQKHSFVLVESPVFWIVPQTTPCQFHTLWATDRVLSVGSSTGCELRTNLALNTVRKNALTRGSFTLTLSFSLPLFKWKNLIYRNGEKTYSPMSTVDHSGRRVFSILLMGCITWLTCEPWAIPESLE